MSSKYQRRHYEETARILAYEADVARRCANPDEQRMRLGQIAVIANHFEGLFSADNGRFDPAKFRKAATL